jgi:transketolase
MADDQLPPLPEPALIGGIGDYREHYTTEQMTAYATAATEALRQRVAELERYERAWNEWRSLQSGDVQKMFDAAMRCAELEQLLKVMERQYADALEGFAKMQQEVLDALADIANSDDMTLKFARATAKRIYTLYRKGESK